MARGLSTFTSALTLLLPLGAVALSAAGRAEAATPTYYNSLVNFQADVTSTVTDDYSNPGYVFIQNDAVMSGVLGQTDYMSTGFNNLNIVSGGYYCAGCNGSFQLSFQTTSVGTAAGVNGVGVYLQVHSMAVPYYAYITFADGTTANIALPAAGNFWGVAAPERIQSIHFGLSMGGTTTNGSFGIDNLIVGDGNIGGCVVAGDCVDDMNPCTDAACELGLCAYVPNTAPCDDGNPCTDDICGGGMCTGQFNTAPCDDGNPCTDDICGGGACQGMFNNDPCDDDEVCTENDVCNVGSCQGSLVDCSDGNPCTTNFCDFGVGCDAVDNNGPCDDGNACTDTDECAAGVCGGSSLNCDDRDPCTADSCDPDLGCVSDPIAGCCTSTADCGADQECDPDTNTCVDVSPGSTSDATGTPTTGPADDTGVGSSGGESGATTDTAGGASTGNVGSTGGDTGTGGAADGGASTGSGCGCTTTPSENRRWWLMMLPLGFVLRRRRRAA